VYSEVHIGTHFSDSFIQKSIKQGEVLLSSLSNFALEYAICKAEQNQEGIKLNGACQFLAYADDVILLGDNTETIT
jgi:hypothetical protein